MSRINFKFICLIAMLCTITIGITACQKSIDKKNLTSNQKNVLKAANYYKEVYNKHNKYAMKSMISDEAEILIGTGQDKRYVSKSEYLSKFPERWKKYPKFKNKFYKIEMLGDNEAKVKTYIMINSNRINIDWIFNKNNGKWILAGYDY